MFSSRLDGAFPWNMILLEILRGAIVAHVVRGEPVGSAVVVLADAILGTDSQGAV